MNAPHRRAAVVVTRKLLLRREQFRHRSSTTPLLRASVGLGPLHASGQWGSRRVEAAVNPLVGHVKKILGRVLTDSERMIQYEVVPAAVRGSPPELLGGVAADHCQISGRGRSQGVEGSGTRFAQSLTRSVPRLRFGLISGPRLTARLGGSPALPGRRSVTLRVGFGGEDAVKRASPKSLARVF